MLSAGGREGRRLQRRGNATTSGPPLLCMHACLRSARSDLAAVQAMLRPLARPRSFGRVSERACLFLPSSEFKHMFIARHMALMTACRRTTDDDGGHAVQVEEPFVRPFVNQAKCPTAAAATAVGKLIRPD